MVANRTEYASKFREMITSSRRRTERVDVPFVVVDSPGEYDEEGNELSPPKSHVETRVALVQQMTLAEKAEAVKLTQAASDDPTAALKAQYKIICPLVLDPVTHEKLLDMGLFDSVKASGNDKAIEFLFKRAAEMAVGPVLAKCVAKKDEKVCGAELRTGDRYCHACGAELPTVSEIAKGNS